jgi:tetratricopeptide (TPR) repeat protein
MTLSPEHPGANHFHIHITEAGPTPERGLAAAYRLRDLAPTAGHLVHMPGHTFIRVGQYHEASIANERAILADDSYITQCRMQGLYPVMYMPHNHHFLWATTTLEGRSEKAIESARRMSSHVDPKLMREPGMSMQQHFWVTPLYALVRFGKWDDILAEPEMDKTLIYPRGVWHYARGLAFLRKGMTDSAKKELAELTKIMDNKGLEPQTISGLNAMSAVLKLSAEILQGEIAAANKDYDKAVSHLERAVQMDDALNYDEPPAWHHPSRQVLGAILLEAGRVADAEKVYRRSMRKT